MPAFVPTARSQGWRLEVQLDGQWQDWTDYIQDIADYGHGADVTLSEPYRDRLALLTAREYGPAFAETFGGVTHRRTHYGTIIRVRCPNGARTVWDVTGVDAGRGTFTTRL